MTQHAQAEAIEKSNFFEKKDADIYLLKTQMLSNANPEFLSKLRHQTLEFLNQSSAQMANNDEFLLDAMKQNESIKAFTKDSTKDKIILLDGNVVETFSTTKDGIIFLDGNATETFSFSTDNSENEVKKKIFLSYLCLDIQ